MMQREKLNNKIMKKKTKWKICFVLLRKKKYLWSWLRLENKELIKNFLKHFEFILLFVLFCFLLDFGLNPLTSLQFIQYHVAGFYKPTIPQSPPSHLRDYSTCNYAMPG